MTHRIADRLFNCYCTVLNSAVPRDMIIVMINVHNFSFGVLVKHRIYLDSFL